MDLLGSLILLSILISAWSTIAVAIALLVGATIKLRDSNGPKKNNIHTKEEK